jgi:uncharacterized protein (DUF58 family)
MMVAVIDSARTREAAVYVQLETLIALRLRARSLASALARRVSSVPAGAHGSRFRGRGVDYRESRIYQPGDDIRHMDWRVTARSGRPHTKLFEEERERSVLLIVDQNPSLHFGTRVRFKSVQLARAAALVAWATVQGGDRIGALGFGGGIHAEIKPGGGPRSALAVLRALRDWDHAANDTIAPLSEALKRARRLAKPGTRVLLLSDGFSADADALAPLSLLAQHCDVAAVILSDTLELSAPPPGRYAVRSGGNTRLFDFARANVREQWSQTFAERREGLLGLLQKRALPSIRIDTRDEPDRDLARLLAGAVPPDKSA